MLIYVYPGIIGDKTLEDVLINVPNENKWIIKFRKENVTFNYTSTNVYLFVGLKTLGTLIEIDWFVL